MDLSSFVRIGVGMKNKKFEQIIKDVRWQVNHFFEDDINQRISSVILTYNFPHMVRGNPVVSFRGEIVKNQKAINQTPEHLLNLEHLSQQSTFDVFSPRILLQEGVDLAKKQEYSAAMKKFEQCIEEFPEERGGWSNKGFQLENVGKIKEVIPFLEKAYRIDDKFVPILDKLSKCYFQIQEFKKAIEVLDKFLKIKPMNFVNWQNKALLHFRLKEFEESEKCCLKVLEIKPEYPKVKELLDKMKNR